VVAARRGDGGQIALGRDADAALPLHRLHDHAGLVRVPREFRGERVGVAVRDRAHAGQQWTERPREDRPVGDAQRPERLAVESARHGDDAPPAGGARELESRLDGLGAGAREIDVIEFRRSDAGQAGRGGGQFVAEQRPGGQRMAVELGVQGRHHVGMPVAEQEDPVAAAVEVGAALVVPDPGAGGLDLHPKAGGLGRPRGHDAHVALIELDDVVPLGHAVLPPLTPAAA
jgi:hypothetical protein